MAAATALLAVYAAIATWKWRRRRVELRGIRDLARNALAGLDK